MVGTHLLPGLEPLGVPKAFEGLVIPFKFNSFEDIDSEIVKKKAKECAAIVMEPCRESLPNKEYLNEIKRIAKNNCVLIFDEITSGWRSNTGGIHMNLGISHPDMAVFENDSKRFCDGSNNRKKKYEKCYKNIYQ